MAGKADELGREFEREPQGGIGRIEPGLAHLVVIDGGAAPAPDGAGERCSHVLGKSQRLPHLANGAARAIAAHHRRHAGAVAAVLLVNMLDHQLAPLMLEIDIDIWRLIALAADEALEKEIDLVGIDIGDAEAKAYGGIRRRAAALT